MCKPGKDLCGLKQTSRSWYARLDKYLKQQGFRKGEETNNIYIKINHESMFSVEVYIGNIIF